MRAPHLLLLSSLLFPLPLLAQPPARSGGPWVADADGDGRITREEMRGWMEQRFTLMDPDGDGAVPVEVMQRMLGHEQQERAAGIGRKAGRGGGGSAGGPGHGGGRSGGAGGSPPAPPPGGEGRRHDGEGAGPPPTPPGTAMPYPEDGNDDGRIDRAEFIAPAMAMFDEMDRNGDGVLSGDELPPPPPPGERRGPEQ